MIPRSQLFKASLDALITKSAPTLWLDANKGITLSTGVASWASRVGAATFTQATGAAQPTISRNAGQQYVYFDGTNHYLTSTATLNTFYTSTAKTGLFVIKSVNTNGNHAIFPNTGDNFGLYLNYITSGDKFYITNYAGSNVNSGVTADTNIDIITYTHDGTNLTIRVNGNANVSNASGTTTTMTQVCSLGATAAGTYKWNGAIALGVTWNKILKAYDLRKIETAAANLYNANFVNRA